MTEATFQALLNRLGSEKASTKKIDEIVARIKDDICEMEEIRIYVDDAINFGHQSSTLALMKQFIDWSGYAKKITIFFKMEAASSLATQNKLALLLPGVDAGILTTHPETLCVSYGTCKSITFAIIKSASEVSPPPKDFIPFGFTGGSDQGGAIHKLLKTRFFLCLQPYMWHNPNRIEVFSDSGELVKTIDLEAHESVPLKKALFLYNESALISLPSSLWDWYTRDLRFYDLNGSAPVYNEVRTRVFHDRMKQVKLIAPKAAQYKALLWPVYGLQNYRHHSEPLPNGEDATYDITGQILFNLVLTGLLYQHSLKSVSQPIVMLLFNTIKRNPSKARDSDLIQEELFGYMNAFIAGSVPFKEYYASKSLSAVQAEQNPEETVQKTSSDADLVKDVLNLRIELGFRTAEEIKNIHILNSLDEAPRLEDGHFYIVKVGSVPMELFNYFFWNADLPPFFEGQGTSSLTILTGRPFFQCSQANNYHSYPTTVFSGGTVDPIGKQIYDMVMCLVKRFPTWTKSDSYRKFIKDLCVFIRNSYTRKKTEYNYFQSLRKTYSAPNHSKLYIGLVYMYFEYKNSLLDPPSSLPAGVNAPVRPLDDIYGALIQAAETGQGSADLLTVLKGTEFAQYFYDVAEGSLPVVMDSGKIEKMTDSQGKLCQVSVSQGKVSLFHMEFTFSLVFSYVEHTCALVSDFSCSGSESWALPGVPWICLENFGFQARVYEGDLPVAGCFTGTLKGTALRISIGYPIEDGALVVRGEFPEPVSALEPFYQAAGGVNFIQSMPETLAALGEFGLKSLSFVYSMERQSCLSMDFCLMTKNPWTIMESPCFAITPEVTITIASPGDLQNRSVFFRIGGQFTIGEGVISVNASYPDFQIHARLIQNEINLDTFLEMFGSGIELNAAISTFQLDILPRERMFFLDGGIRTDWDVFGLFTIKNICFHVTRDPWDTGLFLSGEMYLLPDILDMRLYVQGSWHSASKGWNILARQTLNGDAQTAQLLSQYLKWDAGQYDLPVANMEFVLHTASKEWRIAADVQKELSVPFLGEVSLTARFSFGKENDAQGVQQSHAYLSADFTWNGIDLLLWYNYHPDVQSFGFTWNHLEAVISKNQASEWIGVLRFTEEITLGSIVETLVSWARGSRFGLEAPWNFLDKIPLSGLELEYNFTTGKVGFQIGLGEIDLGFAKITGIQASYGQKGPDASEKGVMITLAGEFPWNVGESAAGDTHSLGPWDAASPGQAPTPNGAGNKYFELDFLALGQHVTFDGFSSVTKVEDAILLMENMSDPVSSNRYDPDSSWMIGADFKILKLTGQGENGYMLRVQAVFNDPVLYALRIVLNGQAAKVLSGLEFQILYKKIKENLGVYQADITLPDSIRYINLGGISITLPVISVAVYTNGDFQVDIGFPWDNDFSRSFSMEALVYPCIPLTGSGGFYFGMLSGETCSRVPQSEKGIFNPVLVFGLGLRVGIGKSFRLGILEAGFSLTVAGILEGIIAKWNPYAAALPDSDSHSLDSSYYYCLQGTIGIFGWLYGKVDFGIIKASVSIAISLMVRFLAESYRPIEFAVQCTVDIFLNLSINLGLFKISITLSFSAEVSAEFLIESKGQAPWFSDTPRLAAPDVVYLSKEPDGPVTLDAYLVTALTVAHDEWESLEASPKSRHTCYVALMFLESSSFTLLCRALLDWLLKTHAQVPSGGVWNAPSGDNAFPESLSLSEILEFLNSRIRINLHQKPLSHGSGREDGLVENAVYFPMIPWLHMEAGTDTCYIFSDYNEISDEKLEDLRRYFDQLAVAAWEEGEKEDLRYRSGQTLSMAEWVFADYFLMLSRQLLKYTSDQLKDGYVRSDAFFNRALGEENLQQLAAMATRYSLHGLRLTTDGIRPSEKGIWVNGENQLPPVAGLFALTGQQFIIPSRIEPEDTYTVTFTMPQKLLWLSFGEGEDSYTISVPYNSPDARRIENVSEYWKERILRHQITYMGTADMVQRAPLTFAFSSFQTAQTPAELSLFGDMGEEPMKKLSLWKFPAALIRLSSSMTRSLYVSLSLEGQQKTGKTALNSPLTEYAFGCLLSFGVRKSDSQDCPMYEITGGKAEDILLLERMLSAFQGLNGVRLKLGYTSAQGSLTIDGEEGLFTSFIKVNLSTQTRPSDLWKCSKGKQTAYESILLLWEALITNQGGFYLYYCICGNSQGLPDAIFDERGRASLSLLVLFDAENRNEGEITNYMNTLITPDLSQSPELAPCVRTLLKPVEGVITSGKESIGELCEIYGFTPGDLMERNPDIRLGTNIPVRIEQGVYLVQSQKAPGGSLAEIEAYFGITDEELKAANPERSHWPDLLEDGQALLLPSVTVMAEEEENSTFERIAQKYGCSPKLLAAINRNTPGILAPNQPLNLVEGLEKLVCAAAPGTAAVSFTVTPASPDSSSQSEELELVMNQYTLLGYHVMENCSYRESNLALPAAPGRKDGLYRYTMALPLCGLRKNPGLCPESPYHAVGTLVQLDYHWQDIFGNVLASQFSCHEPSPDGFVNGMPVFQGYTDELLPVSSWPCINVSYLIEADETGQRYVKILFLFDTGKYEELQTPEIMRQYAALDRKVYQSLYFQMTDPLGVEFQVTCTLLPGRNLGSDVKNLLLDWLFEGQDSIYGYLSALEKGETPSRPAKECCCLCPFDLALINLQDLFQLDSTIEWHRLRHLAEAEFAAMDGVFSASSVIPPKAGSKGSLSEFAQKLEAALRDDMAFQMRLATGIDVSLGNAGKEQLWLVRQGKSPDKGFSFTFVQNRQILMALRPISNHLESMDNLCIPVYEPGSEIVPEKLSPPTGFRSVDLDLWMKCFVTAMDELLSPQMAMAITRIDTILDQNSYDTLLEQKQQMAFGLKDYLVPVLEKDREENMDFARESVYQHLLAKLSDFYEIQGAMETAAFVSRGPDIKEGEQEVKLFGTIRQEENHPALQAAISSTKLNLRPGKQPFVCFIKSSQLVKDDSGAILPGAVLKPVFTGSHLEHDFRSIAGIEQYQTSDWLNFVTAEKENLFCREIPEFYMPFLLRSYPESPQLGKQDWVFYDHWEQGISSLCWDYRFGYDRSCHYPQDQVEVSVQFNLREGRAKVFGEKPLFASLAAFVSLYPQIREDLLSYACKVQPDMDPSAKEVIWGNAAVRSFLSLSEQVVLAVGRKADTLKQDSINAVTYSFCLRESVAEIQGVNALVVCVEGAPPQGLPWPQPDLDLPNLETVLWKEEPSAVWYWFRDIESKEPLKASKGQMLPSRRLCFPGLYLLRWQSALAQLGIKRNRQEIGDSQVDDCFIYQTGTVGFSDILYPFMDIPKPIDMLTFLPSGQKPQKLYDHLEAFFSRLLEYNRNDDEWSVALSLEAIYMYQTDSDGSYIQLPVFLQPSVRLDGTAPTEYLRLWSQALDVWREEHITADSHSTWNENAVISFNLTVFSALTDTPMPLLHLHDLRLAGKYILL